MQVCNIYITTSIALRQVQAHHMLTFVTQSLEKIDKFHTILVFNRSVKFNENCRFRTGIYGNSFLEANLLL